MEYLYTSRFLRSFKKLPSAIKEDIIVATERFEAGERDARSLHKFHGNLAAFHAFSANFTYRIVVKMTKKVVYYSNVGTHDVYQ